MKLLEQIPGHISVWECVSATCAIITQVINLTVAATLLEKVEMLENWNHCYSWISFENFKCLLIECWYLNFPN